MRAMTHPDPVQQEVVSFWQANEPPPIVGETLVGDVRVDVAIIGGGFTGLTAAREIKADEPGKSVMVLESRFVGFGASGRNGGFNMTLFGLEPDVTILRWGRERAAEAQRYMIRAVRYVHDLVRQHDIASDYQHTGMLRVAYSPSQLKRLEHGLSVFDKLGIGGEYQFQDAHTVRSAVHSPRFRGAVYEANSGILNPFKHVRELKRLAEAAGAIVHEGTPVLNVERSGDVIRLVTPRGTVTCDRLVIAVNAWSGFIRGLPKIRSRQTPVWTSQVVTEPLTDAQWNEIGWQGRESIENNRQLIHYFRRTVCGRITMGGGDVARGRGPEMGRMDMAATWDSLEGHLKWLFPVLGDTRVDFRWGGPVSVNLDMTPEIGFIGDERIIYANGCIGHGVALTQLNGRAIADMVLGKRSDLTDIWFINRKAIPWPPEPLGALAFGMISGGLRLWDWMDERGLDGS
jgi:glycine/D-amino acid oxidase-like deaminating enzyme